MKLLYGMYDRWILIPEEHETERHWENAWEKEQNIDDVMEEMEDGIKRQKKMWEIHKMVA